MGGFKASNTNVTVMNADDLEVDSGTLSVDASNNRIGIGLTTPKTELTVEGAITLKEAANASSDTAAYGQLWVKSDAPCNLYFTDDTGQDVAITADGALAAAAGSLSGLGSSDNRLLRSNGTGGETAQGSSITVDDSANMSGVGTLGVGAITSTGALKIGSAAGSGVDAYLYTAGTAAHVGIQWDADGATEGMLIGGADDHGVDFKFFGETAGNYIQWDMSGDELVLAATSKLSFHDAAGGENIVASSNGHLEINSGTTLDMTAPTVDINASTTATIDTAIFSVDGTDDSNVTVTGSGKDLDIAVAGGSTQELRLASAGTGASALHLNASAGGINIDAADMLDIDAADEITIDTTSADGHIAITSAHTAGQSILISANAAAGAILDIDAGIIDIDVQDTINIDAADEIEIATTSADGHITLTSAHVAGVAFHLDANAHADSEVQIDAGILDIDVTGAASLDSSAGSITIGAALADGQTLKLGKNGAVETIIAPHGTAGSEAYSVTNTAGTTDGAYGQGAMLFEATAGGIGLKWADGKDLWAEGGRAIITANEDAAECIKLHADAGTSQTIVIVNDGGTDDGAEAEGAILIEATVGGIGLHGADDKRIWAEAGQVIVTANENAADAIKLHADAGANQTITIVNDAGTGASAVGITSTAGGVTISGDTDHGVIVGNASGGPVTIGHTTSETTVSDNLTVSGDVLVAGTTHLSSSGTEALRIGKADADSREIVFESEGTDKVSMYMNSAENFFIRQEDSSKDINLRIGTTNAVVVDGSASEVVTSWPLKVGTAAGSGVDAYLYTAGTAGHVGIQWDADGETEGILIGGANDHGVDFKFFGESSGKYVHWDMSGDELVLASSAKLSFNDAGGDENIVASADGHLEVNAGTTLDMTAPTVDINASTAVTVDSDLVTFGSANANDPLVIIKNTTDDTASARLRFVKDRGAAGEDNDNIGTIEFYGDDDAETNMEFASIGAQVADASNGAEGGRLVLRVATHDGEMQSGITIQDGDAEDEVDVTIGNGAASLTTIAGEMKVTEDFFQGDARRVIYEEVDVRKCDTTDNTVSVQFGNKIPQDSVVTRVVAIVKTASNLGTHNVNIRFDAGDGRAADYDAASTSSEALGGGASTTRSSTNVGSPVDIDLTAAKESYINDTPSFMTTADVYPYVMNAGTSNGTSDASSGTLLIYIEYYGID